jgi:hypothetical protein
MTSMSGTTTPDSSGSALASADIDSVMVDIDDSLYAASSHAAQDAASSQSCRLLSLPVEVRRRIWSYCFHNDSRPIPWPANRIDSVGRRHLGTQLLRTCKAIYKEAAAMVYQENVLLFRHPSDANMFLYAHNVELARKTTKLMLHILDRDLTLWACYLAASSRRRSLMHDYPSLTDLSIVLRSSPGLVSTGPNLREAYVRWKYSSSLAALSASLKPWVELIRVRVLFVRLATQAEEQFLIHNFPNDFDLNPAHAYGPRLRTKWTRVAGIQIALDATPRDNPWYVGSMF